VRNDLAAKFNASCLNSQVVLCYQGAGIRYSQANGLWSKGTSFHRNTIDWL